MLELQVLEVQQGIWIDAQQLHQAGLGAYLQMIVQPGEIHIVNKEPDKEVQEISESGWAILRALGHDALPGRLPNAAVEHDRYIYGKQSNETDIR